MPKESPRDILIRTAKADKQHLDLMQELFSQAHTCRSLLEKQPETKVLLTTIEQIKKLFEAPV